jgi:hypothetical protein
MVRRTWLKLTIVSLGLVAVGGITYGSYLVVDNRNSVKRQLAYERKMRDALTKIVVDEARCPEFASDIIDLRMYNPTTTNVFSMDAVFHVVVYDPELKTTFDRRFRGILAVGPQASAAQTLNVGVPFNPALKPKVVIEPPADQHSEDGKESNYG